MGAELKKDGETIRVRLREVGGRVRTVHVPKPDYALRDDSIDALSDYVSDMLEDMGYEVRWYRIQKDPD